MTCASFDVFVAIASVFSERSSAISEGDAKSVRNVMCKCDVKYE